MSSLLLSPSLPPFSVASVAFLFVVCLWLVLLLFFAAFCLGLLACLLGCLLSRWFALSVVPVLFLVVFRPLPPHLPSSLCWLADPPPKSLGLLLGCVVLVGCVAGFCFGLRFLVWVWRFWLRVGLLVLGCAAFAFL